MRTHLLFLAALGAVLAAPLQAQWLPVYGKNGNEAESSFGFSMARLVDRDGDTFPELLVGALGADANGLNSGAVYVLHGESGNPLLVVPGESAGGLFGAAVTALSDLNSDGTQDFAVSAPYFTGLGGFFSGRVYIVSGIDGSFLDSIDGLGMGELFGVAIAGTDVNGDGVSELAVGAVGAAGGDGEVRFYQWSGGVMTLMANGTMAGAAGSDEWFGFSMENLGNLILSAGHEMVIGAPYADDGGVDSGSVTAITNLTDLRSYAPSVAGVRAGYSVSAIMSGFQGYVAAGSPTTANGTVFIWDGRTMAEIKRLDGATAGAQFGYDLQLIPDRDFDGFVEIVVGAPNPAGKGKGYVIDFLENPAPTTLLEVEGTLRGRLGAVVAETGDINGTTASDLAFAAPDSNAGLGRRQGRFEVWTPPDSNLPPPVLELLNDPVLDSPVGIKVTNVKPAADLYLYAGTAHTPGTTAEGFQMDISSYFAKVSGHDYFELATGVTGGSHTTVLQLPITIPNGIPVYFQAMEKRGIFERLSSVDGGVVLDRPIEFDITPPLKINTTSVLKTTYGHRSTSAIVYYFMGQNVGSASHLGINTGLSNPFHVVNPLGSVPDQYGNATFSWPVPASIGGTPISGLTVLLSTVSWHAGNQRLGYFGPVTIL